MRRKIVEVVWDDHAFYQGEFLNGGLVRQRSMGYVVQETRDVIKIAQSYQKQDKKWYDVLVIDKRTIRAIKEVT